MVEGVGDPILVGRVGEALSIPGLWTEDAYRTHQRPKTEWDEDREGHFVVLREPFDSPEGIHLSQLALYSRGGLVVSFQERPGGAVAEIRQRVEAATSVTRGRGAEYLTYRIVDTVVDAFFPLLERTADEIEGLEEELMESPTRDALARLHVLRRRLRSLARVAIPTHDAVAALSRVGGRSTDVEMAPFYRDLLDHAQQIVTLVDHYSRIAGDLRELAQSTLDLRLNQAMRALAAVSTIFLPLGFVVGLYGMNFDQSSPWNMPELGWRFGYPAVLVLLAAVGWGMYRWFSRRGYTSFEES